jgi:hypothetical protein
MFFRIFGFCGLSFGSFVTIYTLLGSRSLSLAIRMGVVAGVLFGLMMAIALTAVHWWSMRKRGFDPDAKGSRVDARESVALALPPEEAIARCRAALEANPHFRDVRVDPAAGTVNARSRMSWASFGEVIECRVRPGDGGSTLEIRSRPAVRSTIVDYGKNRENVERIRTFLAQQGTPDLARQA